MGNFNKEIERKNEMAVQEVKNLLIEMKKSFISSSVDLIQPGKESELEKKAIDHTN